MEFAIPIFMYFDFAIGTRIPLTAITKIVYRDGCQDIIGYSVWNHFLVSVILKNRNPENSNFHFELQLTGIARIASCVSEVGVGLHMRVAYP